MRDIHVYGCVCSACKDDRDKLRSVKGNGKYTKPFIKDKDRPTLDKNKPK